VIFDCNCKVDESATGTRFQTESRRRLRACDCFDAPEDRGSPAPPSARSADGRSPPEIVQAIAIVDGRISIGSQPDASTEEPQTASNATDTC
jgi:hypothetical protein